MLYLNQRTLHFKICLNHFPVKKNVGLTVLASVGATDDGRSCAANCCDAKLVSGAITKSTTLNQIKWPPNIYEVSFNFDTDVNLNLVLMFYLM